MPVWAIKADHNMVNKRAENSIVSQNTTVRQLIGLSSILPFWSLLFYGCNGELKQKRHRLTVRISKAMATALAKTICTIQKKIKPYKLLKTLKVGHANRDVNSSGDYRLQCRPYNLQQKMHKFPTPTSIFLAIIYYLSSNSSKCSLIRMNN